MEEFKRPRPIFPKRAIVTAGMPYGNKDLHFGYIFGLALQADIYARFLKCRIGKDNVIFITGTDCYGTPLEESYRKMVESGEYNGSISDLVKDFHNKQDQSMKMAQIEFDYFAASAFGDSAEEHKQVSKEFFELMYQSGALKKMDTEQFYDEAKECFINGRQVIGKCPIEGCKSSKAYSDECELGHQYLPKELVDPVSMLSNTKPVLKSISNWYLDMLIFKDALVQILDKDARDRRHRKFVSKEVKEFLKLPEIYIKRGQDEKWNKVKDKLPKFEVIEDVENKPSFTIQFSRLEDREDACKLLSEYEIRYRNGKTLVPFRISGNCDWGVPLPEKDGLKGLTFYVWPESLWAPISFSRTYIASHSNIVNKDWRDWWCSDEAEVYQFLAEDNVYFYGPPQQAIFLSTQGKDFSVDNAHGCLKMTNLIVNRHSLFMGAKASSSGVVRAPLARELLEHYTVEQMRMHYLAKNLGDTNANFTPKAYNPNATPNEEDPAIKEGNLLINIYNRILRKYSLAVNDYFDGVMPVGEASDVIKQICHNAIIDYEDRMYCYKFHILYNIFDKLLREINKYYEANRREIESGEGRQKLIDILYSIRVANTLLYPVIPHKAKEIADFFGFNEKWLSWDYIFDDIDTFVGDNTTIKRLEDENPFFKKHHTQI